MKMIHILKSIILLVSISPIHTCVGRKIQEMEKHCKEITESALLIENLDAKGLLEHVDVFNKIETIQAGIILKRNTFETLELENLKFLFNPTGPAIQLHSNTNLKRLKFPVLQQVKSNEDSIHVLMYHDGFSGSAYKNKESYRDLLIINHNVEKRKNNDSDYCFENLIKNDPPKASILSPTTKAAVLLLVISIVLLFLILAVYAFLSFTEIVHSFKKNKKSKKNLMKSKKEI